MTRNQRVLEIMADLESKTKYEVPVKVLHHRAMKLYELELRYSEECEWSRRDIIEHG